MSRSTRIRPFEKSTGANAITPEEYKLKVETTNLNIKSSFFVSLTKASEALLKVGEELNQASNNAFNECLFKLLISVKEHVFTEFTLQGIVFAVCWLAASMSDSFEIIGFERNFNSKYNESYQDFSTKKFRYKSVQRLYGLHDPVQKQSSTKIVQPVYRVTKSSTNLVQK